ncbi:hypothetical protein AFM11_35260 [Mycolicibacterium wolinskyi]|uniref:Uncharacterized protein n=1 Tax=Mycolicibacterium wolinskyi TaxID=59750 RepID=A0A132PB62_9MYCO|nr:hypothetical protein AFM11_35260 [Mycolicibacterium wolinskyi]
MAFYVRVQSKRVDQYDDEHDLIVHDSGIIEVKHDGQQVMLYSPAHWTEVKPGIYEKTPARVTTLR